MVNKNNVMAGLFLVGGLLLAVAMSFWLGEAGRFLGSKTRYLVHFDLITGAAGLQAGSDVTLAGQSIGRVTEIRPVLQPGEEGAPVPVAIEVEILVDSTVVLYEDAFADLNAPLLGGVSSVNFSTSGTGSYPGGPPDANDVLDEGEVIRGRLAPGVLAQLGLDAEAVNNLKATFAHARSIAQRVDNIAEAFEADAGVSSKTLREILADVEGFTQRLDGPDGWGEDVDRIVTSGRDLAERLGPATERFEELVSETRAAVADARGAINDNRDRVANILGNAEAISEAVRYDSVRRVHELLDRGILAAASYGDLADQLNVVLDQQYPPIRRAIANVVSTTEQASGFVSELRAQPWRVLKQPDKEDLAREPIYAAARDYARAVADLRSAGEALDSVVSRVRADGTARAPTALDAANLALLRGEIDSAFDRYKAAEEALLERMMSGSR